MSLKTLIIGPAYSGKSAFANTTAQRDLSTVVLGTANLNDAYFNAQLQILKDHRPSHWKQQNVPFKLCEAIEENTKKYQQMIVDSINQWLANLITDSFEKYDQQQLMLVLDYEINSLVTQLQSVKSNYFFIVSSEVGASITPVREHERIYRQTLGRLNQTLAKICDNVYLLNVGIASKIK